MAALEARVHALAPDVVVVSGDVSQRARPSELEASRRFLDRLPAPHVVVPGNHDIAPWMAPLERLFDPFLRYATRIDGNLEPSWSGPGLSIIGLNTVAPLRVKQGWLRKRGLSRALAGFAAQPSGLNVLVAHHGLDASSAWPATRDETVMKLAAAGIDVLLCGHGHHSADRIWLDATSSGMRSFIEIAAGTGASERTRGEPNAFNVLDFEHEVLDVRTFHHLDGHGFTHATHSRFTRSGQLWEGRSISLVVPEPALIEPSAVASAQNST